MFQFFQNRNKKIAEGSFGQVYSPNYACPDFKKRKSYISKMMKSKKDSEFELKQLKKIKKIDPTQKYLATFETSCASSQRKFYKNIIMKNFGVALVTKKYKLDKTYDHVINVYLKQMLKGLILLHKNGIYHKDMHDRNTVYDKETNRYRIIDFGLSISNEEIDETLKMKNIKKAEDLETYFDNIILRGDGYHETFNFEGYNIISELQWGESKDFSSLNLNKIKKELKKTHEYADVNIVLINDRFLEKEKEDKKK